MKAWMLGLSVVLLTCVINIAFAAGEGGLGALAGNVNKQLPELFKLITAGAYLGGIAFALFGLLKLKAHKDAPTQVPLSTGIVYIFIGAGLAFLPNVIASFGYTVFGAGATPSGITGVTSFEIKPQKEPPPDTRPEMAV